MGGRGHGGKEGGETGKQIAGDVKAHDVFEGRKHRGNTLAPFDLLVLADEVR